MNWLDIVIAILLIISLIGGFANGLIKSLFSLVGLIVGVVLAGHFYIALAESLSFISNDNAARIVAFIIIFLVVMILFAILGMVINKLVSALLLGWLNRLFGGPFSVCYWGPFLWRLFWSSGLNMPGWRQHHKGSAIGSVPD